MLDKHILVEQKVRDEASSYKIVESLEFIRKNWGETCLHTILVANFMYMLYDQRIDCVGLEMTIDGFPKP